MNDDKCENVNFGVIAPQKKPTDWDIAGETGILYEDRKVKWKDFLPKKERQSPPETSSCVTFSLLNVIEVQLNYLLSIGLIDKEKAKPYLDDEGKFNLSDRWLSTKAKTTKTGANLQDVLDTFRKVGCVADKDLPFGGKTFEEYHDESLLTPELDEKAKKLLEIIEVAYQWLWFENTTNIQPLIEYYLKHYPIQVAGTVCSPWQGKEFVKTCPIRNYQHATMIYGHDDTFIYDLDHYEPYFKKMNFDYPFLCGLGILVSPKKTPVKPPVYKHNFTRNIPMLERSEEVMKLQKVLKSLGLLKVLPTGYYGELTRIAVKQFQINNGIINNNGVQVGPQTRARLNSL